ncbi:DUF1566 domain-containing protein, partial [Desulfobacterales bacterium HSG2]|nr:DUF1566 domain-containing protein [Desulfobacterales bacterium HSG2]
HGAQSGGENYLIPVEANIRYEKELRYKAVSAGMVLAELENARSRLNILILDACRDTPAFSGTSKAFSKSGLASMDAPVGTIIAYATAPGKVAREGPGRYSLYTANLIQSMKIPGLDIEDVFKRVRRKMVQISNGTQIPWERSSLVGDFYFAGGSAVIEQPAPAPVPKTGGLRVRTTPSGATIRINGRKKGRSPLALDNLKPGTVRIHASLEGYGDEEQITDIQKGMITQVSLYLDRIVSTERLETEPSVTEGAVRLRSQSRTLSDKDVQAMVKRHNFFCKKHDWSEDWYNESGNFDNDFVKSSDGKTVTDRMTGLMWQQSGANNYMNYEKAQAYIDKLNRERFAGYSDWRLPTLEELMSLMEREKVNGLYIDPVFDRKQRYCWSADKRPSGSAWSAAFSNGYAYWHNLEYNDYVRAVRS